MKSVLPILALLTLNLAADTIRLRDKTELEGTVLREEGDAYVVEVMVTSTIKEEKRIPKSTVLEIVGEKKDAAAFEAIEDLVPTEDLLTLQDYDSRIALVEAFQSEFPNSRLLRKTAPMLEVLDKERKSVVAGGIKFQGRMIESAERRSDAYPLDARIAASKVERMIDEEQPIAALRAWDELAADFSSSKAYAATVPGILELMRSLKQRVDAQLAAYPGRIAEQESNLTKVPAKDRSRVERALAEDAAARQRLYDSEKKRKIRWLSIHPLNEAALKDVQSALDQEIKKLAKFDASAQPDGDAAWTEAWTVLGSSPESAEVSRVLGAANTARLPDRYIEALKERAPAD